MPENQLDPIAAHAIDDRHGTLAHDRAGGLAALVIVGDGILGELHASALFELAVCHGGTHQGQYHRQHQQRRDQLLHFAHFFLLLRCAIFCPLFVHTGVLPTQGAHSGYPVKDDALDLRFRNACHVFVEIISFYCLSVNRLIVQPTNLRVLPHKS